VVVASNGEKDLNSSTPGEEADESTKSGISVSDDATLAEEQSAASASSSSSSSSSLLLSSPVMTTTRAL
jgi:hypothetical protein